MVIVKNYLKIVTQTCIFFVLLSIFFLKPSFSLAVQDCRVGVPYACYNSRVNVGGGCYNGNWRVRGTVFCDSSDTGVCNGTLYINNGGVYVVTRPFSLPVGGRLDTNNTFSATVCSQMVYDAHCFEDFGPGSNYQYLPRPELISPCSAPTPTPTLASPTNTPTPTSPSPTPTNTPVPTPIPTNTPTLTPTPTCSPTDPSQPQLSSPPDGANLNMTETVTLRWLALTSWGTSCLPASNNRFRVYLTSNTDFAQDGDLTNEGSSQVCNVDQNTLECVVSSLSSR